MSFVTTAPELMSSAATDLAAVGSRLEDASAAAAVPTSAITAPAADEISAAVTALFNGQAQAFQALQAQASAFHQQFVGLMNGGAAQYLNAEVANVQQIVNGTFVAETGRPLFGDGASGYTNAQGVGTPGGNGGWLWGNGGSGGDSTAPGAMGGNGGSATLFGRGGGGGAGGSIPGGTALGGAGGHGGTFFLGQPGTGTGDLVGGAGGTGGSGGLLWGPGGTGGVGGVGITAGGNGGAGGNDSFFGAAIASILGMP